MREITRAITRWLGDLGRGEDDGADPQGFERVRAAIGLERIAELQRWFAAQPAKIRAREQKAAIQACIFVAHADRELHDSERELIEGSIDNADLDDATKARLREELVDPGPLLDLTTRLTQPVLRELALLLAWDLALADGRITREEKVGYFDLTRALGVDPGRARAFKEMLDG